MYYVFVVWEVTRIGTIKLGVHKASNELEKGRGEKKEVEAHKSGKNESLLVKSRGGSLRW